MRDIANRNVLNIILNSFLAIFFLGCICQQSARAQDDKPLFFINGSDWGRWSPYPNYPHIEFHVACGDESQMKGHPVSSLDWEIRSKYPEPMAVVFRVQFYDDRIGKDNWSGWMKDELQPGKPLGGGPWWTGTVR